MLASFRDELIIRIKENRGGRNILRPPRLITYAVLGNLNQAPLLVGAAHIVPLLHDRSVRGGIVGIIQGFARAADDDLEIASAQIHKLPLLIQAAAIVPLLDLRAVGGGIIHNIQRFARAAGQDFEIAATDVNARPLLIQAKTFPPLQSTCTTRVSASAEVTAPKFFCAMR